MESVMAKTLVVGGGGREGAIAEALLRSPLVQHIYVAPGNGGTMRHGPKVTQANVAASDHDGLVRFCRQMGVTCVIVGPEEPLVCGITAKVRTAGIVCFGPDVTGALLEGSKSFGHIVMQTAGVPTPDWAAFSDYQRACNYVQQFGPLVVKADGLCGGKGVTVCDTVDETLAALKRCMLDHEFGVAGNTVVLEERLVGPELSVMVVSDGVNYRVLPASQDHKHRYDGNLPPMTGSMGACCPVPLATPQLMAQIEDRIIRLLMAQLPQEGIDYCGILYFGLMITADGPKVLEINCRGGDPELQVVLALLQTDFAEIVQACVTGTLGQLRIKLSDQHAVLVVLANDGYPGSYQTGQAIFGFHDALAVPGVQIYHAGTAFVNGGYRATDGRVLNVLATGDSFDDAFFRAYLAASFIHYKGKVLRTDIGRQAHQQ